MRSFVAATDQPGVRVKSRGGRGIPAEFVDRCARIVPDLDVFLEAMERPLLPTVRVNTLKATREEALDWLAGLEPEPVPWWELAFTLREGSGVGRRLEHFIGLVYAQDAASMVPPLVLAPEPGETVLDIAAAPGSKTTQMAAMMANRGLLIANDYSRGRVRGLIGNIDRAGCLNVCVCRMDGIKLARELESSCDRVLVDAPCTCEGILRRTASVLDRWSLDAIRRFERLQKGLIVAGYRALRPGGTMVYSTCTVAPEENEVVLGYLLERFPEAETLPVELAGFRMRSALAGWEGVEFPAPVANARRILPQDNDTEAFFVARVRKP
ncbi:MAG: RsmB/NOP family class I SAM-dependent RNA methyltransferase [bacterium]